MKKNGFITGAFIAIAAIIVTKIIGLLYVIPFYAIIGEEGGALYGYAYTIYNLFLIVSSAGIPLAISKITSEYETLGLLKEKSYIYNIAKKIILIFSIVSFMICFFGADVIAKIIIGDMTGGNTIEDIALVIRSISFAIIIAPFLSVVRGFLQGHKYITSSSISQIYEQLIRIIVILVGSYLSLKVFKLDLSYAVSISVFGATVGALVAYLYLLPKVKKINVDKEVKLDNDSKKEIKKKIIRYVIPFVAVNLSFYLYSLIDMLLIIRTLDYLKYAMSDIELISSVFTTWGNKLISVVSSFATGLVISLIPNMVSSYTKKNMVEVNHQYTKAFQFLFIIILPISLFLSIYSNEVWMLFYGKSYFGPIIFRYMALLAFIDSTYLIIGCILQNLNKNKIIYTTIFLGLGLNVILDVPLMLLFDKLGIYPYYGAITATIIGYVTSIYYAITTLKNEDNIMFNIKNIVSNIVITLIVLIPLNIVISMYIDTTSRVTLLGYFVIIGLINAIIYYIINKNVILILLGDKISNKFLKKKEV